MNEGQILVSGSSEDLVNNEEAKRIYLGTNFSI
jgi:ABC-type lipopolysaccharide export system ATPase subunit